MFHVALIAFAAKKLGTARLRGVGRVLTYSAGLTLIFGAVGIHKARASLGEQALKFGEDLATLAPMMKDVKTFHLNDQVVHTATTGSLEGVTALLDKYEASCKSALGNDAVVWDKLPDTSELPTDEQRKQGAALTSVPIIRMANGKSGTIACFVPTSSQAHSPRSLQAALEEYRNTGNFSAFGKFRYAYIKEGTTGSMVVTVWSDGDFDMKAFIPTEGRDTPGSDPTAMMRPEQGQRLFTGTLDVLPYRVYGYRSQLSPEDAIKSYDAQMEKAGWLSVTNPIFEGAPHVGNEGRAYIHKDKGLAGVVSATRTPDGRTMIGIAEVQDGKIAVPTQGPKDADGF